MDDADGLIGSLRRHDRDRYLTMLLAPAERRAALVALYAFNFEVAKTREVVKEPMLGQIRLQWWREAIDEIYRGGTVRQHEVVQPLAEAIRRFDLTRYHLDRLIDGRAADLDEAPPASLDALERYGEETSARLIYLALEILGARDEAAQEAARHVGVAWSLVGRIRALPAHVRARRRTLPADLVAAHALDERDFLEFRPSPALAAVVETIVGAARGHLAAARALQRRVPRAAVPALLPASLAGVHLRRLARAGYDPFAVGLALPDTLAIWRLALAAFSGRY